MKLKIGITIVFACLAFGLFAQEKRNVFKQGYYYDLEGNKHKGLIKFEYYHKQHLWFKEEEDDVAKKIKAEKLNGFVIPAADSFLVARNFQTETVQGGLYTVPAGFVQLLIDGKIKFYKFYDSYFMQGAGNMSYTNFLIQKEEGELFCVRTGKKKFKEQMAAFFSDQPEWVEKFLSGEYDHGTLEELIVKYNSSH